MSPAIRESPESHPIGGLVLDAQREEQERIADTGAVPLVVTLVEHDGRTVAVMVTVIPMPAATMH